MRRLTEEEIKTLSAWEGNFRTAINSSWSRYPGVYAVDKMEEIYNQVTGTSRRLNKSCSTCILHLLQDLGAIYFKQKEEDEKSQEQTVQENPVVRVTIKEKSPKKPRAKKANANAED